MTSHHLDVLPISRQHWVVQYEGDVTPIAEAATQTDARVAALNFARQFGEDTIHVHHLNGECHTEQVDPDFEAPTPRDVKGPHFEP